jgi:chromosomal replication initiator protein
MFSSNFVWAKVLSYMEQRLGDITVSTWFDDAEVVELTEDQLILYSSSPFRQEFIRNRCADYIHEALKEIFNSDAKLVVFGDKELAAYKDKGKSQTALDFNPQFNFDNFVVGPSNRFAHAAASAVANKPADIYNPLFIYGPSGLGKTHLLHAIANTIRLSSPDKYIVYIKGDEFTNELIRCIQKGTMPQFREKYRNADLLLVDDIQFVAGKQQTQEEFFHTFNELHEHHKQIVMTSDRPPSELLHLEDRLRTRFQWGLIADINPPDYETRMAIIRNKAISLGMTMPDDVCSYIAENITTNIRQIEGTVKKIKAYAELTGMVVNVPNVTNAIKDMYKGNSGGAPVPTPNLIIREVSRYYNIEEKIIVGTQRTKGVAEARQMAMYLIRKLTNLSFPDVAKVFGKNHATVMHSVSKIHEALADSTNPIHETIRQIEANIDSKV